MYSRMDPSNERCEAKSNKKYDLSSKKGKHEILPDKNYIYRDSENEAALEMPKWRDETASSSDSQNIMLRVSDSFVVQDTQENDDDEIGLRARNFIENEIIVISDSSDDERRKKNDLTRMKIREKPIKSSRCTIYTIRSSDSEDENVTKRRGPSGADKSINREFAPEPNMKKCSIIYTSDETLSDRESERIGNMENNFKSQIDGARARDIMLERDDSIFSFDGMRGVLTENSQNIFEFSRKTNEINQNYRKIRIDDTRKRNDGEKNHEEINRRIDESRKTPIFSKITKTTGGSSINLKEISSKIRESRKTPDLPKIGKNETESLKNREIGRKIEESREFGKITKIQTASLNNLLEMRNGVVELEKTPEFGKIGSKDSASLKNSRDKSRRIDDDTQKTPISAKISSRATLPSSRDLRNILRVIKSKRAVYESPREYKKRQNSKIENTDESNGDDDEDVNDDDLSDKSNIDTRNFRKIKNPIVIAETDSDSEDIIRGSNIDLPKPYKTHVTRFLEPSTCHDSPGPMSERKKYEIAHWLMTNSLDTRSAESSFSNVSASNKNSPSSGNSSLERLEMNYETPNNRDKMRNANTDEREKNNPPNSIKSGKSVKSVKSGKSVKSTKLRQTTIDNFIKKTNDDTRKIITPIAAAATAKKNNDKETNKLTENLGIMDCADILDNLYGNAWRSKANDLLPSTEPRKKNIVLRDKGVQTERKARKKRITKSSDSSSQEDGFDTFVRNIKPNLNSTKKPVTKPDRRRCNFIKDSSSSSSSSSSPSDSRSESTYLTALTNPRTSDDCNTNNQPTPLSLNIQRAIAICDSESEDDNYRRIDNRKVLSFSDDDSDTGDTSEYDPNDVIPAKVTTKSRVDGFATTKNAKISNTVTSEKITKKNVTFLASLSPTICHVDAHPEAKKYRQDYKNTKEELCKYLYRLYNEKIFDDKLPADLSIEWNVRMRGTAGFCYNKRSVKPLSGVKRSSRIVLATKILDTPDRLRDTLVHEMCHAAAWLINDVSDGHGPFWKAWAAKAMRTFPELPEIKRCHDYKITTKFTYRCTGCGYSVGRHSKSLDIDRKRCGHCYGKFELLINKMTKSGKIESRTPVTRKATGFALYVKENYSTVKKKRNGVQHKEVMQILGQQFSAIKITRNNDNSKVNGGPGVSNDSK